MRKCAGFWWLYRFPCGVDSARCLPAQAGKLKISWATHCTHTDRLHIAPPSLQDHSWFFGFLLVSPDLMTISAFVAFVFFKLSDFVGFSAGAFGLQPLWGELRHLNFNVLYILTFLKLHNQNHKLILTNGPRGDSIPNLKELYLTCNRGQELQT